jgi:cytochrome b pre-mRNA-processing protein 3
MFGRLFAKDPLKARARVLYDAVLDAARKPALYGPHGAPDTVDGRFDLIVLHAILLFRRLRDGGEPGKRLAQLVFDIMFDDMDAALREMGTGDLSVGKRIKAMGEAFYGRAKAYEAALAAGDEVALTDAIVRNMFDSDGGEADAPRAAAFARYAMKSAAQLAGQAPDALIEGEAPGFARSLIG